MRELNNLIVLLVLLCSCNTNQQNPYDIIYPQKPNIEKLDNGITVYNDDNFKLKKEYKLEQTIKSDSVNSYQFIDLTNKIFYKINISNLTKDLSYIGLNKFDSAFKKNFMDEYIRNLEKDKYEFKMEKYLNKEAIISDFIVTNNNLINDNQALLKARMLIVLNINKSYTISVISEPDKLDNAFNSFKESFHFIYDENIDKYISTKYNYEIIIPSGFIHKNADSKNIDFSIVKSDRTTILVLVSDRIQEEYNITAHDYSKEFLENSFKQYNPSLKIIKAEKIIIDNNKAFLMHYISPINDIKALEIHFFKGDYAYVLTGTALTDKFNEYENIFLETFNSLKFN